MERPGVWTFRENVQGPVVGWGPREVRGAGGTEKGLSKCSREVGGI